MATPAGGKADLGCSAQVVRTQADRKSTRLNSSHGYISYAVFCVKKKKWFLLPRVPRLMIHTPTAIRIFVCLCMVQLIAVIISMRCPLCGHFLQVAMTLILVVGSAIAAS